MMDMYSVVTHNPILAILRNIPTDQVVPLTRAIADGGIRFFEVALNSPDALRQIGLLREHFGDSCQIGAGTAITVQRCRDAINAGAGFLLTPGTPADVLEYCASHGISLLPGVLTPCDVATALQYGFQTMKLFPAASMPARYVRDLQGPFDNTHYVAIGGVNPDNLVGFLQAGYLGVGLGSSLFPKELAKNRDWEAISVHVRKLVDSVTK